MAYSIQTRVHISRARTDVVELLARHSAIGFARAGAIEFTKGKPNLGLLEREGSYGRPRMRRNFCRQS